MIINEMASQISAPASEVWDLLVSETGQKETLSPFIERIEFSGSGLGSVRTLYVKGHLGSGYLKEELTHLDESLMEVHYRIVDTGGSIPFADYTGRAQIYRAGQKASILLLRSSFVPVNMSEEDALSISKENFKLFIQSFHQHFSEKRA